MSLETPTCCSCSCSSSPSDDEDGAREERGEEEGSDEEESSCSRVTCTEPTWTVSGVVSGSPPPLSLSMSNVTPASSDAVSGKDTQNTPLQCIQFIKKTPILSAPPPPFTEDVTCCRVIYELIYFLLLTMSTIAKVFVNSNI